MNKTRRSFLKTGLMAAAMPLLPSVATSKNNEQHDILLPKAIKPGDTIGLITPASPLFEAQRTLMEAQENLAHLGFKSRAAKNIFKKHGYLAGTVGVRMGVLIAWHAVRSPSRVAYTGVSGYRACIQLMQQYLELALPLDDLEFSIVQDGHTG